jgi:hypothetical protein
VVLDFGQVARDPGASSTYDSYGTYIIQYPYPFRSDTKIRQDVEHYAAAWWHSTSTCPRLHIVVGLNNQNECPVSGQGCAKYTAGVEWANVLADLRDYLVANHFDGQITAWAGDDIETGWDSATATRKFVDGFNDQAYPGLELINFGDAWASNQWSTQDICYVSYGATHDWPLPEAYTAQAVTSWILIRNACFMYFRGVMSTTIGYTASDAWTHMWNALNNNGYPQTLQFSTRIKYQP